MYNKWKKIWNSKGTNYDEHKDKINLSYLLASSGYDMGAGAMSVTSWKNYVSKITKTLKITENQQLLEVGCGAGAFLYPLRNKNVRICGIDYSESLIKICKEAIPSGTFFVEEAGQLPFENSLFDVIVSMSVFHYFPNQEYTEKVLNEMLRCLAPGGKIALLDINDVDKQSNYEQIRKLYLGEKKYNELYSQYSHLFYSKEWFKTFASNQALDCFIEEQDIEGYGNSQLRFNVFLFNENNFIS